MYLRRKLVGAIAVSLVSMLAACIRPVPPGTELCTDGVDNDGDTFIDCADLDCATATACVGPGMEICTNGLDDDGDGLADCADTLDCGATAFCNPTEDCNNGLDDDGDGLTDCDDTADCAGKIGCGGMEICDDGVDNDGDGLIDCIDTDCNQFCIPEVCDNMMDEDGDGLVDCADEECATTFTDCVPEICDNLIDDDFDLLTDCADDECVGDPVCIEDCTDGIDNDADGDTDCNDTDCAMDPACFESVCDDMIDNDGDGNADCLDIDCTGDPSCPGMVLSQVYCSPNSADRWTFNANAGDTIHIVVDTVDAATAFDIYSALFFPVGSAPTTYVANGDDDFTCTFPPASWSCPDYVYTAAATGTYEVSVEEYCSCPAVQPMNYSLVVEVNGVPVPLVMSVDDGPSTTNCSS